MDILIYHKFLATKTQSFYNKVKPDKVNFIGFSFVTFVFEKLH